MTGGALPAWTDGSFGCIANDRCHLYNRPTKPERPAFPADVLVYEVSHLLHLESAFDEAHQVSLLLYAILREVMRSDYRDCLQPLDPSSKLLRDFIFDAEPWSSHCLGLWSQDARPFARFCNPFVQSVSFWYSTQIRNQAQWR